MEGIANSDSLLFCLFASNPESVKSYLIESLLNFGYFITDSGTLYPSKIWQLYFMLY